MPVRVALDGALGEAYRFLGGRVEIQAANAENMEYAGTVSFVPGSQTCELDSGTVVIATLESLGECQEEIRRRGIRFSRCLQ
jgi:hypothetical protein